MKAPDKIYTTPVGTFDTKPIPDLQDNIYIRKDIVDETIQTAEDHAYFAGKEKMREELMEWAGAKKSELFNGEPTDVAVGINAGMDMIIKKLKSL